jgi:RecQ mediated genome instability protein
MIGSSNDGAINHIKEQLEQVLGVVPSDVWFRECCHGLQQQLIHAGQRITSDFFLEQILFHDLRDVVRTRFHGDDENQNEPDLPANVLMLREAIAKSQLNDCKFILPSSFRCFIQIEEICDVSKNSESRLKNDVAISTANRVSGGVICAGSSGGCHKFCYTDGYYPGQPFVAIEVTPIVRASTSAIVPGTKVLLTGPITVRHGMMGWHTANLVVLGGHVDRLLKIQQDEMKKVKQMSGHGIDPTIRALIWNQQVTDDNPNDEGL